MRAMLLIASLLCTAPATRADPTFLEGGALVAHNVEQLIYSTDPPAGGWCAAYGPYAISSVQQVDTELPQGSAIWYVLAAWLNGSKIWCGVEFGFGPFDPGAYAFYEYQACFPGTGLEISTPGWPGPLEGTAFVTTGLPWQGNWIPVYWFGGYAYDYTHGATVIVIDVDPVTGFCGLTNCAVPVMAFEVSPEGRGGMGVNMPGTVPLVGPVPWACCLCNPCGTCTMLSEWECGHAPGIWMGPGITCDPNPCPPCYPGACCIGGSCIVVYALNCHLQGGTFQGVYTDCAPNPCPAVCCFPTPTAPHGCEIMLEDDCAAAQGLWHPEWTACEPNPCEAYTPVEEMSWGRVKSLYR